MKAMVIRSYIDKYTMEDIDKGAEIEVTEERFSELTTGPQGIFVEEIKEILPKEQTQDEESPLEEPKKEEPPKKTTKK